MSIIITGLEMPTERESFNLTIKYNGVVLDAEMGIQVAEAYELPAHGRLIDADALIETYTPDSYNLNKIHMTSDAYENLNVTVRAVKRIISEAHTVIPAESAEEDET